MTDLHQPYAEVCGPIPLEGEDGLDLLARVVEAELHSGGWDQEAVFGMLWRGEQGSVRWRTQDLPPVYLIDPASGLLFMADVMESPVARAGSALAITDDFMGWAAVIEGWALDLDMTNATAEQRAEFEQARQMRTVKLHPDRVETRSFYGCTVEGHMVVLIRKRDHEPELLPDAVYTGRVPDALRRLAAAGRLALQARHS